MLKTVRDRGNSKWAGLMVPEHVAEYRRWQNEDHYGERQLLDDIDMQAIQHEIKVAQKRECEVHVKLWDKGKVVLYMGVIREINVESKWITVDSPFGRDRMLVKDIIDVKIAEK